MAEANDIAGIFHQNLLDAGCDNSTIDQCLFFIKQGDYSAMLPLLGKHRALLLDSIHTHQKKMNHLKCVVCKIKELGDLL